MNDMWYSIDCPKCKFVNWVNNGNLEDQTVSDVEGLTCWHCDHKWWFLEEEYSRIFDSEYFEAEKQNVIYVQGKKEMGSCE
ncbi:MAG: hypothetical protein EKK64_00630 [Neisseriaceae bacterium]|nr:MAG: hypothetical protein EKK64_00630 [Neisseriaceae bacterium]